MLEGGVSEGVASPSSIEGCSCTGAGAGAACEEAKSAKDEEDGAFSEKSYFRGVNVESTNS